MSEVDTAVDGASPAPLPEVEQQKEPQASGTVEDAPKEEPKPKKRSDGGFQRRINELTWKTHELERQLAQARTPQPKPEVPPNFYEDPEGFIEYKAKEKAETLMRQAQEQAAQGYRAQQFQETQRTLLTKAETFAESHPDFYDAIADLDAQVPIGPEVAEVIAVSDVGPQLAYYLSQNVQEARQIASLPPHLAAARLARIEGKLAAPVAQKPTNTPAPVPTLSGSAITQKDPSKMSYAEYKKYRQGG